MAHNDDLFSVVQHDPLGPMLCSVREFIRKEGKTFLRVELRERDVIRVKAMEDEVRQKFPRFESSMVENQLVNLRVPTQYGVITIDMKTIDDERLLPEHITSDIECILSVRPSKVITQLSRTICSWVCTSLIANVKYN